jgi:hypothetical protein
MLYLNYRDREFWGRFDDLHGVELKTYADGSLRQFRWRTDPKGKWHRELERERSLSANDLADLRELLEDLDAWNWSEEDSMPVTDGSDWLLRVRDGGRRLSIKGPGAPPDSLGRLLTRLDDLLQSRPSRT